MKCAKDITSLAIAKPLLNMRSVRIPFAEILLAPFLILLVVGLVLPSDGQHGLINIKSLSLLACVACTALYVLIKQAYNWKQFKLLGFLGWAVSALLLWLTMVVFEDKVPLNAPFDQLKVMLITILFTTVAYYFYLEERLKFSTFLKFVIYTNFTYSFVKVTAVILHVFHFINIFTLMKKTGLKFMSMAIYGEVNRMQTSVDIITPFLLFFILESGQLGLHFNRKFKIIYLIVSAGSILLSFSRVFIAIAFVSLFLYWITTTLTRRLKSFALCLLLAIGTISYVGTKPFEAVIEMRLHSEASKDSDETRNIQIVALMKEHQEYPIMGKGIGSYSKEVIRDKTNPHSYEVQWVAFLMQFGVVGLLAIGLPIAYIFRMILKGSLTRLKLAMAALFGLWLLAGFTNPFLISLTSGIVYALFLLAACEMQKAGVVSSSFLHD